MIKLGDKVRVLVGMHRGSVGMVKTIGISYVSVHLDHIDKIREFLVDDVILIEPEHQFTREELKELSLCVAAYLDKFGDKYYPDLFDKIQGLIK